MAESLYPAEVEVRLWQALDDTKVGMLGVASQPPRLQPMTAFCDPKGNLVWFFASRSADLTHMVGDGAPGVFTLVPDDHEIHACLTGDLTTRFDRDVIDRYWNATVSAWYPKGKDDPDLVLLAFRPEHAEVWISKRGPVRFGWEVAKSKLTGERPDWGQHARLHLH